MSYQWVEFYHELADKIRPYRNKQSELIDIVKRCYTKISLPLPSVVEQSETYLDPFTFFGLFNRQGMKAQTQIDILTEFKEIFHISAAVPKSFDGITRIPNKNSKFAWPLEDGSTRLIDCIWDLFLLALDFSEKDYDGNKSKISFYFKEAIKIKNCKIGKLSIGLFWTNPENFLDLAWKTRNFIYNSNEIPQQIVDKLPEYSPNMQWDQYYKVIEVLSDYFQNNDHGIHNFIELSLAADVYDRHEKNNQKDDKISDLDNSKDFDEFDNTSSYTAVDFLNEVFMNESDYKLIRSFLERRKNIILQGPPGTGKTFSAKRLAYSLMGEKDPSRVSVIQFHQSYSYEDFMMGYRPSQEGFEMHYGPFYSFCQKADADREHSYFFIIDEINRGNISKIFGELMMLVESDKRDQPIQLLYSEKEFAIPENMYLIGTMNTADRSLAIMDYALRRRFGFFTMKPAFDSNGFRKYQESLNSPQFNALIICIEHLNQAISKDSMLGPGFCIGQSYFCNLQSANSELLKEIVHLEIIPLLQEYWYDDAATLQRWTDQLENALV